MFETKRDEVESYVYKNFIICTFLINSIKAIKLIYTTLKKQVLQSGEERNM